MWKYFLLTVSKNYMQLQGRARRKEYWGALLFMALAIVISAIIDTFLGFSLFTILTFLGLTIPTIALAVRRLHDIGATGWFVLLLFIPAIGPGFMGAIGGVPGQKKPNKYGPDPKADDAQVFA